MMILEIKNLEKAYSGNIVLDQLNYKFDAGTIYGIVGENGVGKTTLFNCLANNISYKGDVCIIDDTKIGYLPDKLFFYSKTTGKEYIDFFISARGQKPNSAKINRLNEIFRLPLYSKYTSDYSSGMKKKLAFMAILLQENDLYILDEPFNNLDIKTIIEFQRIISLLAQRNKTLIISSHILEPLKNVCYSITILNNGKFVNTFRENDFKLIDSFFEQAGSNVELIDEII